MYIHNHQRISIQSLKRKNLTIMKINHHISLLIVPFFLVLFSSVSETCEGVRIDLTNGVGENTTLALHCKSKDDDLGVKYLQFKETWWFHFRPNIWGTTLFFCSFQWDQTGIHWFVVYQPLGPACSYCRYNITAGGPCLYDEENNKFDKCSSWNS